MLSGLVERCKQLGVVILEHCPVVDFLDDKNRIHAVRTSVGEEIGAAHTVVTAGAWSGELLKRFGESLPIYPVQGQIIVFETPGDDVRHIILEGKRYLVPRDDGLVLVGATEEENGFVKQVTEEALHGLRAFACDLFPALIHRPIRYAWAGLRPGNKLGHPIIGPLAPFNNLWLATGHFRHGLQQAPGTARLIADWITGKTSFAEPADFAISTPASQFSSEFHS
jgi:glycine oxidase